MTIYKHYTSIGTKVGNHKNLRSNIPFDELPEWFKNSKTFNAVVDYTKDKKFIFHNGNWIEGDWYGDEWKDGIWYNGSWHGGLWHNGFWKDGLWKDGIWEDGLWSDGTWYYGVWKAGEWRNGTWYNGLWYYGIWKAGIKHKINITNMWEYVTTKTYPIFIDKQTKAIKIGCQSKSVKDWEYELKHKYDDLLYEHFQFDREKMKSCIKGYELAKSKMEKSVWSNLVSLLQKLKIKLSF